MSTEESLSDAAANAHAGSCSTVEQIIQPRQQDLGGFSVRRALPFRGRRMVGPWIFFDHMGPVDFAAGPGINVRPHPHINLATVTYLFEGEMLHRDSLGSEQLIRPGAINLMIAGHGVVHSERERPEALTAERRLNGLQLWLALPEDEEEREPEFLHYDAASIPSVELDGASVRVMMGSAYAVRSPVKTLSPTLYLEMRLSAGARLRLPDHVDERALYLVSGEIAIDTDALNAHEMGVLRTGAGVDIVARRDSLVVLIGGEALGERHIWWNFVSSRRERIELAKTNWAAGNFPKVPGDEVEFIPLPAS